MTERERTTRAAEAPDRSFKSAYGVLQRHAETLRDQDEPNIDDLLTIVTESVAAYKVCKERIDAVEAALKAALEGAGVGTAPAGLDEAGGAPAKASAPGRSARTSAAPPPPAVEDDDIPF